MNVYMISLKLANLRDPLVEWISAHIWQLEGFLSEGIFVHICVFLSVCVNEYMYIPCIKHSNLVLPFPFFFKKKKLQQQALMFILKLGNLISILRKLRTSLYLLRQNICFLWHMSNGQIQVTCFFC